jgi:hypothetical protein
MKRPIFEESDFLDMWKREAKRYNIMKNTLDGINEKYNKTFKPDKSKYFRFLPEEERKTVF